MTYSSNPAYVISSTINSTTANVGGTTTLNGGINDTETSIIVTLGKVFAIGQTIKIDTEYMIISNVVTNTLTVSRGDFDSTATTHLNGATVTGVFIGGVELNAQPEVFVMLKSDTAGKEYFEFSVDGTSWGKYPLFGFTVLANVNEVHKAVKGKRYFRIVFENGSASATTSFSIKTQYGIFGQLNLPLNQTISSDSDSTIVKAVTVGAQPDGDYVNTPANGEAFNTTATLAIGGTYTSNWIDTDGWATIELVIVSDVISADNGIRISFTDDTSAVTPTTIYYKDYTYNSRLLSNGYYLINNQTSLDGIRVSYTNGPTIQGSFYLSVTLKTQSSSESFNSGGALLTSDYLTEVSLGNISNQSTPYKFGRSVGVGTGSTPIDVWGGAGLYTGHPRGYTPETIQVFSSSVNDTSAGVGARTVIFEGLKTNTSTSYETSEMVTLNGTTAVTTASTWWRINRVYVVTAGSSNANVGLITVRASTTTTNIFCYISIGYNQSALCAYTCPYGRTLIVKRIFVSITRDKGAAGSGVVSFRVRPDSSTATDTVYRTVMLYDIQTGAIVDSSLESGIVINSREDLKFRIESVSDLGTNVNAKIEFLSLLN